MSVKKDLATIEGHLEPINHEAEGIVFDNSTNGFTSTNVQKAIEEAKASATTAIIPEYSTDPVSPMPNSVWVLQSETVAGSPLGLLLVLTEDSTGSKYELSYKTTSGSIVRTLLTE